MSDVDLESYEPEGKVWEDYDWITYKGYAHYVDSSDGRYLGSNKYGMTVLDLKCALCGKPMRGYNDTKVCPGCMTLIVDSFLVRYGSFDNLIDEMHENLKDKSCKNCKYCKKERHHDGATRCGYNPPVAVDRDWGVFPIVKASGSCGKFEERGLRDDEKKALLKSLLEDRLKTEQ